MGTLHVRKLNTGGDVGSKELAIFDRYLGNDKKIGKQLQWMTNRMSCVIYQTAPLQTTVRDLD